MTNNSNHLFEIYNYNFTKEFNDFFLNKQIPEIPSDPSPVDVPGNVPEEIPQELPPEMPDNI